MKLDFNEYCEECGVELTLDGYASFRRFCCQECQRRHYKRLEKVARLEAKEDRAPCAVCGGAVDIRKDARAIYCSTACQQRACSERFNTKVTLTCPHCGRRFQGRETQTYCSPWCAAQHIVRKHQPRPCERCGGPIVNPRRADRRYCGITCAALAREAARRRGKPWPRRPRACLCCGVMIERPSRPDSKYCSPKCALWGRSQAALRAGETCSPSVPQKRNRG